MEPTKQQKQHKWPKRTFGRFWLRLVIFFTLFFLLIYAINQLTYRFAQNATIKVLRGTCASNAEVAVFAINNIFEEVYKSATLAELMPAFQKIASSRWKLASLGDYADVPAAIRALSSLSTMNEYISNIALYRRDLSLVVTDTSMYQAEDYFQRYRAYEGLTYGFWQDYQPGTSFAVMPPLAVHTSSSTGRVLPVVKTHINNAFSQNLYLVDLNLGKIEALLNNYCPTPNSTFLIMDDNCKNILCSSTTAPGFDEQAILAAAAAQGSGEKQHFLNGQTYYVYVYQAEFFFTRIHTVLCIPQADLVAMLNNDPPYLLMLRCITPLLALLLIVLFSRKAYEPLARLMRTLEPKQAEKNDRLMHDELQLIRSQFSRMDDDLKRTKSEMEYTDAVAREQLLRRLILGHSLSGSDSAHLDSFLPAAGFYTLLLIKPIFRDALHQAYPLEFTLKISATVKHITENFFVATPNVQVVELRDNRLCVLVFGLENHRQWLKEQAQALLNLFKADEEELSFFMICSTPCTDRADLPQACHEAEETLSLLPPDHPSCIYDASAAVTISDFEISLPVERKLINLIVSGKKEELFALLRKDMLLPANLGGLATPALQKMLMQFYFITAQALRESGRVCSQSTYEAFAEFNLQVDAKTPLEISEYLFTFFENIFAQYESTPLTLSSELFRSYIDNHFTEDLSLESLAQKYNTSAQYIARLLKKELGMSFQAYLHQLRIAKAKELLLESTWTVNEICTRVGYQSRNTFIRSFKVLEGLSPSEYRHVWKSKLQQKEKKE